MFQSSLVIYRSSESLFDSFQQGDILFNLLVFKIIFERLEDCLPNRFANIIFEKRIGQTISFISCRLADKLVAVVRWLRNDVLLLIIF